MQRRDVQAEHLGDRVVLGAAARGGHADEDRHHRHVVPLRHVPVEVRVREREQVALQAEPEQEAWGATRSACGEQHRRRQGEEEEENAEEWDRWR